jgi:hypothetical protein
MDWLIYKGEPTKVDEPGVPVQSRAVAYGDGCFDTLRSYGGHFLMLEQHIDRLHSAMEYLGIEMAAGLRKASLELHEGMNTINQPNLHYYFTDFEGATHYSLVGKAIPDALENIFSVYRPITRKDYDEILLKLETPVFDYLIEKYATIENLFGLKSTIRQNDIIAVATASEKKEEWESLEKVAKLAKKEHPETMLGDYYLARYYEETGNPRKAMRTYQAAYNLKDVAFITADLVLEKADQIKKDFNY